MLSEISQTGERQILYDITYMWNLKIIQMIVYTKQKQIHRHRKQTCGYHKGEGSGEGQIRGTGLTGRNYYI